MPSITPAVKLLLILNLAAFLLTDVILPFGGSASSLWLMRWFALDPTTWIDIFPLPPLWQLVSYGFLHGGLGHLLGNALFLYFLGTMLEGVIGTRRLWAFYLSALILAGFLQLLVGLVTTPAPILGASGGVLAIVCAMATLRPQTRIIFILFPITLKTLAIFYVAFDVLNIVHQLQGASSSVASVAHLSGAAFGFFAVRAGWIWRDPIAALAKALEARAQADEAASREKLDELLGKISREGIGSLSPRERAFLKKASKRP